MPSPGFDPKHWNKSKISYNLKPKWSQKESDQHRRTSARWELCRLGWLSGLWVLGLCQLCRLSNFKGFTGVGLHRFPGFWGSVGFTDSVSAGFLSDSTSSPGSQPLLTLRRKWARVFSKLDRGFTGCSPHTQWEARPAVGDRGLSILHWIPEMGAGKMSMLRSESSWLCCTRDGAGDYPGQYSWKFWLRHQFCVWEFLHLQWQTTTQNLNGTMV